MTYNRQGLLHSFDDYPSYVYNYDNNIKYIWHINGVIHRDHDKPAYLQTTPNNDQFIKYIWFINGKIKRLNDLPSEIIYVKDSEGVEYTWRKDDKLHREDDKPAYIMISKDGSQIIKHMKWVLNGRVHRDYDKPADIYLVDGIIDRYEEFTWYRFNTEHRDHIRPSRVGYLNKTLVKLEYRTDGKFVRYAGPASCHINRHGYSLGFEYYNRLLKGAPDVDKWRERFNIITYCALLNVIKRLKRKFRERKRKQLRIANPSLEDSMIDIVSNNI